MAGTHRFPDDVPTLVDGEVTLRAHQLSDVDAAVEQCVDQESIRWTTVPVPFTRDDAVQYLTKAVPAGWTDGTELGFAIEAPHADGVRRFSGSIAMRLHRDGVGEIAYGLHPGARGRSVCRRAMRLILDWGFQTLGLDVVLWYANVGNWTSRRVAWASGFTFDGMGAGLLRQRGERKDAWVGSLRATDTREPKHAWLVPPVLETDRLRLRPVAAADADRLGEHLAEDHSRHFRGRVKALRELTGEQVVQRCLEAAARGERYDWTIAEPDTDRFVGHIQLSDLEGLDDTEVKVGYGVHHDSRRKGYLVESLTAVTDWAFRPVTDGGLGKRRVSLTTAASNEPSRRGVERAGYVHIGTEPQAYTIGDTDFDDMAIYHRLNPDWRPR